MKILILFIMLSTQAISASDKIKFDSNESFYNFKTQEYETITQSNKHKVFVFLSKNCPCSKDNLPLINRYANEFPMIEFIGIHAMKNKTPLELQNQNFKDLDFSVYNDPNLIITNLFKAHKTPHVFIVSPSGDILYQGGVTNSMMTKNAKTFYLKMALDELKENKAITINKSRTLGCYIER